MIGRLFTGPLHRRKVVRRLRRVTTVQAPAGLGAAIKREIPHELPRAEGLQAEAPVARGSSPVYRGLAVAAVAAMAIGVGWLALGVLRSQEERQLLAAGERDSSAAVRDRAETPPAAGAAGSNDTLAASPAASQAPGQAQPPTPTADRLARAGQPAAAGERDAPVTRSRVEAGAVRTPAESAATAVPDSATDSAPAPALPRNQPLSADSASARRAPEVAAQDEPAANAGAGRSAVAQQAEAGDQPPPAESAQPRLATVSEPQTAAPPAAPPAASPATDDAQPESAEAAGFATERVAAGPLSGTGAGDSALADDAQADRDRVASGGGAASGAAATAASVAPLQSDVFVMLSAMRPAEQSPASETEIGTIIDAVATFALEQLRTTHAVELAATLQDVDEESEHMQFQLALSGNDASGLLQVQIRTADAMVVSWALGGDRLLALVAPSAPVATAEQAIRAAREAIAFQAAADTRTTVQPPTGDDPLTTVRFAAADATADTTADTTAEEDSRSVTVRLTPAGLAVVGYRNSWH